MNNLSTAFLTFNHALVYYYSIIMIHYNINSSLLYYCLSYSVIYINIIIILIFTSVLVNKMFNTYTFILS